MKRSLMFITFAAIMLLAAVSNLSAAVPQTMNYQGRLTDTGGPVTSTVSMTFTFYDAETVGNSKWTEIHTTVSVVDGLFNVVLGAGTPPVPIEDTVFTGADRWLEIVVEGETITPRTKLASNPYSFQGNWNLVGDVLYTSGDWGIARAGNTLLGIESHTHVNLGVACTTGTDGSDSYNCTVSGGKYNTASGEVSTVGGGYDNTASGWNATVGSGGYNIASGEYSTVAGGAYNTASGYLSTVVSGINNVASNDYSIVGGGNDNTASGLSSAVGGGYSNRARGDYSVVAGGGGPTDTDSNSASGFASVVSGGK